MDRHKQFITHETSEVKHLIKYNSKNLAPSTSLFVASHHVVQDSYEYKNSLEVLKTLRTVLCLCYQHKFIPDPSKNDAECIQQTMIAFDKLDVDKIQSSLDDQLKMEDFSHWTELSVVLDILVLHMALYYKVSDILECLEKLQNLIHQHLKEHNELTIFHTKLMDCYVDSLLLHKESASVVDELEAKKVKTLFLQNVQLWLKLRNQKNTDLLVVIFPKLIKVVSAGEILTKVWEMILTLNNSTKTVSMLHLTADVWFPKESEHIKELIDQSLEERLWLLLLKELSSLLCRQSKPALELAKRIVDFIDNHRTDYFKFCQYQELRPLVCFGNDIQQGIFKKNLNYWFLVLEELDRDDDEEHVVTPDFILLNETFKETPDIHGFHMAWIRCIYSRILQDWNLDIMKWGLHEVLTLDLALYNDEFLDVVLDVLCDTYYYGNYENQEDPLIVKKLVVLLNSAETKNSDLVTRFMVKASTKYWCPAALFYFIHALSMVNRVESVWKEVELEAVKSIVEQISSTVGCPLLRIGSQIKILETMTHFATESLDLLTVANTLSAFPTGEALIRGQLAWKLTSSWLSKLVKEEEAMSFLENICDQIAREGSQTDISMKSLSLIIMLFHDAHFLLNSESCRGFTALRNLLNCLIDENSGPYDDSVLENRSIELVHHLLDLASLKDGILYEFISNYVDAILRFTFRILRHVSDGALIENIDTYVRVTQKFFAADSLFVTKPETLKHIERFEIESWYIIEDKQWSNNLRRFFGIKILHACLKSSSAKQKNYKFIGPLCKAYRIPMTQPAYEGAASNSQNTDGNLEDEIASEYYKFVAQIFCDYLEDEPVDEWLPEINWIEEVSYLIQVGGGDIYAPLVGILSQIFFKEVLRSTDIADFKSVVRSCWKFTLGVKECGSTTEEMMNLIFSSPFLECEETRELTIECAGEMIGRGEKIPELRVILLNGLKRLKGEDLRHFYNPLVTCLLHGGRLDREKKIEHQAKFYVLERYRAVYPNYLSNIRNANTDVVVRVHAVTLMYKMITDDPTHAVELLPLILDVLNETQNKKDLDDDDDYCMAYHREHRILQSLLVLQPILETDAIESLHRLLCNNIFSENSVLGVRLMQELLLIRIYLDNEYLLARVWDLFEKRDAKEADGICSVLNIVYHVAVLLSTDLQMDFLNAAFEHIMPCSMSQQLFVRLHTQALTSKLYDLAAEKSYSIVAEKYKELHTALTRSFKYGTVSISLEDDFDFTVFHPIDDYSLETLFYELPRLYNASSDDYIPPQMLEKFGFKESNSHPLKLLNVRNEASDVDVFAPVLYRR